MGKLPESFEGGRGNPINVPVLSIETRKEEHSAILRESGCILVAQGVESLSHVDRRGPAAVSAIETDEEFRTALHASALGR